MGCHLRKKNRILYILGSLNMVDEILEEITIAPFQTCEVYVRSLFLIFFLHHHYIG
jgi:hypothetical protein